MRSSRDKGEKAEVRWPIGLLLHARSRKSRAFLVGGIADLLLWVSHIADRGHEAIDIAWMVARLPELFCVADTGIVQPVCVPYN
jgi:hypothetical protein